MLTFLKKRSYDIAKILVDQLAIALFGISLAFATSNIPSLSIATSVFSVFFFLVLIYIMMWELGYKDRGIIKRREEKISSFTGLYMGLVASIPKFLLATFIALGSFFPNTSFLSDARDIATAIGLFLEGMYMGIFRFCTINGSALSTYWFMWFLITIPMIVTASLAYYAGTKEFKIFPSTPKKN